jgi:hypothetical protein
MRFSQKRRKLSRYSEVYIINSLMKKKLLRSRGSDPLREKIPPPVHDSRPVEDVEEDE